MALFNNQQRTKRAKREAAKRKGHSYRLYLYPKGKGGRVENTSTKHVFLSSNLVFLGAGRRPRTKGKKQTAKRSAQKDARAPKPSQTPDARPNSNIGTGKRRRGALIWSHRPQAGANDRRHSHSPKDVLGHAYVTYVRVCGY